MVVSPAPVAHITDLDLNIITNPWSSLELLFFFLVFPFLICFLLGSSLLTEEAVELLFLLPVSGLACRICALAFLLVLTLRVLFRLLANSNIIDVNLFEVRSTIIFVVGQLGDFGLAIFRHGDDRL